MPCDCPAQIEKPETRVYSVLAAPGKQQITGDDGHDGDDGRIRHILSIYFISVFGVPTI